MNPRPLSSASRVAAIDRLASGDELDVLVVGGGVVGTGCALDAVTRGLTTGLVEARDFASGTSSRSSKLVHGGLRYLKMLELPAGPRGPLRARAAADETGAAPGPPGGLPLPADPPRLGARLRRGRTLALRQPGADHRQRRRAAVAQAPEPAGLEADPSLGDPLPGGEDYLRAEPGDAECEEAW